MEISLQSLALPDTGSAARAAALDVLAQARLSLAGFVEYEAGNRLLILGPGERAVEAARVVREELDCAIVDEDGSAAGPDAAAHVIAVGRPEALEGYLGAFHGQIHRDGALRELAALRRPGQTHFDLVLDLSARPHVTVERPPVGYHRVGEDPQALAEALQALPEMVGEFQKPRYFAYQENLCAHGSRGVGGCTRCIDACATGAIRSAGERVEVDPYLCQGCGSCATTCPSGAMGYAFPSATALLGVLRAAVQAYRNQDAGGPPCVLFHDDGSGGERLQDMTDSLPERVLPVAVEDVGSIGPETWFALLAFGVSDVLLLLPPEPEASLVAASRTQLDIAGELLAGIGESPDRVRLLAGPAELDVALGALADHPPRSIDGNFSLSGSKREIWQRALFALADPPPPAFSLSAGAPFGNIEVDQAACTLCMACAAVCPVEALTGAGGAPRLEFAEDRCVQCGICERACPEDAIGLAPRMDVYAQTADGTRVLNEDVPFHCLQCGKPFASERIIDRITGQLAAHWMFQDDRAVRRLKMCDDCRVRDLLAEEGGMEKYQ